MALQQIALKHKIYPFQLTGKLKSCLFSILLLLLYNNIEKERNNLCYSALFQMFAFIS